MRYIRVKAWLMLLVVSAICMMITWKWQPVSLERRITELEHKLDALEHEKTRRDAPLSTETLYAELTTQGEQNAS